MFLMFGERGRVRKALCGIFYVQLVKQCKSIFKFEKVYCIAYEESWGEDILGELVFEIA